MKRIIVFVLLLILSISSFGEETKSKQDPFNLSEIEKQIEENGVPTEKIIIDLKNEAFVKFNEEKYEEAAKLYSRLAKYSNWYSNLLKSALEPYYGASYDDRQSIDFSEIRPLIKYESKSNEYITLRNEAFVKEAKCYMVLGNKQNALPLLIKSLDLINVKNYSLWKEAREMLFEIIETE